MRGERRRGGEGRGGGAGRGGSCRSNGSPGRGALRRHLIVPAGAAGGAGPSSAASPAAGPAPRSGRRRRRRSRCAAQGRGGGPGGGGGCSGGAGVALPPRGARRRRGPPAGAGGDGVGAVGAVAAGRESCGSRWAARFGSARPDPPSGPGPREGGGTARAAPAALASGWRPGRGDGGVGGCSPRAGDPSAPLLLLLIPELLVRGVHQGEGIAVGRAARLAWGQEAAPWLVKEGWTAATQRWCFPDLWGGRSGVPARGGWWVGWTWWWDWSWEPWLWGEAECRQCPLTSAGRWEEAGTPSWGPELLDSKNNKGSAW